MADFRRLATGFAVLAVLLAALFAPSSVFAQSIPGSNTNIQASLIADGPAVPGESLTLALLFRPNSEEWHGYWENPGDAGYGMQLEWDLPPGWQAGQPQYPVPERLLISGLMNHIYEGDYAVLVPVSVPEGVPATGSVPIGLKAQWLACTDKICVPEQGALQVTVGLGQGGNQDSRFAQWRAAIPAMIDADAVFQVSGQTLRIAVPIPHSLELGEPHIFIEDINLVNYAAPQVFRRAGDTLVAEIALSGNVAKPERIAGILSFGSGEGVRFQAVPGAVASGGSPVGAAPITGTGFALLLLAALAGGLILNIMPCVFPILSLKALSLARAGGHEKQARTEAVAYSAGVILACAALGGVMLALRAAGEQVGWAFQLQEPAFVVALLVLAVAITMNLAGLFSLPSIPLTRSGEPASAFATGLLAAVAATPCTGPFMAAAIGAALLMPAAQALLLFAVLGLGLALPFLLIGFVPSIRRLLPSPGPWMERFRRLMAIPMGLTALALIWLVSRIGGQGFALVTMILLFGVFAALAVVGRLQQSGKMAWPAFGLISAPFLIFAAFALPASYAEQDGQDAASLLDPVPFSDKALAQARASGRPVFIWFTADWCLTCKVNESVAIEREATRAAFAKSDVIAMRGDWTRRDPEITEFLTRQGAAGVPLYIWYRPGGEAAVLPQVLTPETLVILAGEGPAPASGTARSTGRAAGSD
ncbi:protein-disulfide reductase DsbD family protein [Pontixanthobacter luteolus]|uniref:protein-disulfide reductase DsbD family protein n=1 Tax=Pontixanthobacter luteolus TaxID=295089 RepID=UPI002302701F|nr:thioredoxin family protein [Pontixanthobacter luteolus]